jgi:hypothetical protein
VTGQTAKIRDLEKKLRDVTAERDIFRPLYPSELARWVTACANVSGLVVERFYEALRAMMESARTRPKKWFGLERPYFLSGFGCAV